MYKFSLKSQSILILNLLAPLSIPIFTTLILITKISAQNVGINTTNPLGTFHVKSLDVAGAPVDQQNDSWNSSTSPCCGKLGEWQSFTAGITGLLTKIDLRVASPNGNSPSSGHLYIYSGEGTGGALLLNDAINYQVDFGNYQSFTLSQKIAVTAGMKYTIAFDSPSFLVSWIYYMDSNVYNGGVSSLGANTDISFKAYIASSMVDALVVKDGKIGAGTLLPINALSVNGNIDVNNKIGIRTVSPNNPLTVVGNADITERLGIGTSSPQASLHVKTRNSASSTVDQQQTSVSGGTGANTQWQSFTAGITGLLTKVDLYISSPITPSASSGTIKIYENEGTSGTLLSTTSVTYQPILPLGFQSFTLSTASFVTAGSKYTIQFSAPTSTVAWVGTSNTNPYSGGIFQYDVNVDIGFKTYISTSYSDAMVVTDGKVGIGTINPSANLDIAGSVKIVDGSEGAGKVLTSAADGTASWQNVAPSNVTWSLFGNSGTNVTSFLGTTDNQSLRIGTNDTARMIINSTGKVGIGTSNPEAPLHLVGAGITTSNLLRSFFNVGTGTSLINNMSASGSVLCRADGYYWANGGGYVATSDRRIKNVIGKSNGVQDLATINKIEITDYTFIDQVLSGHASQKKVIAQQVKEVYPLAIKTNEGIIPNVYQKAKKITPNHASTMVETDKEHGLVTGDIVKLILEKSGERQYEITVTDNYHFSIPEKIHEDIFVYGKKVSDLLSVDYEAIAMLNVSATQELSKQLHEQNEMIKQLQEQTLKLMELLNTNKQLSTTSIKY
jgi:hypothetical protein